MASTEAQKRAVKKWQQKNRGRTKYWNYKSMAGKFVKEYATHDDLKELMEMIKDKM